MIHVSEDDVDEDGGHLLVSHESHIDRVLMEKEYEKSWNEGKVHDEASCSWLASWHLERSSFIQARKYFGHLVHINKSNSDAWLSLCVCTLLAGDVDEGERALQESIHHHHLHLVLFQFYQQHFPFLM